MLLLNYTVENGDFFLLCLFFTVKEPGFLLLEVRLHSISLKGTLGKSVWSTSILTQPQVRRLQMGKFRARLGGGEPGRVLPVGVRGE